MELHTACWSAIGAERGSALLLHGLGEHSGRQSVLAGWLSKAGLAGVLPDLPGHGQSAGRRGDAPDVDWMLDRLLPAWQRLDASRPRLLVGHSFGGLLAVALAARLHTQVHALVLSSPFFDVGTSPKAWQRLAAKLLRRLAPGLPLPTGLDARALSRDPQVAQAYRSDPRVHGLLSARLYAAMQATQARLPALLPVLRMPVLLWHGSADRLTSCPASARLAPLLQHPLSRMHTVEGGFHELYHDLGAAQLEQQLRGWLDQVLD